MNPTSQERLPMWALIPIEEGLFDTEALRFAGDVVTALGMLPRLLHLFASEPSPASSESVARNAASVLEDLTPEHVIEVGDFEAAVCRELAHHHYALLVLGTCGVAPGRPPAPINQRLANSVPNNVLLIQAPPSKIGQMLLCTTGQPVSSTLVHLGLELAKAMQARTTLLHVASGPPAMYTGLPSLPESLPVLLSHDTPLAQHLKDFAAMAESIGVEAEIELRHGIVAEEILRECEVRSHDLVVLGAAAPGRTIDRLLLDEIAPQVIANVPGPILIVRHAVESEDDISQNAKGHSLANA